MANTNDVQLQALTARIDDIRKELNSMIDDPGYLKSLAPGYGASEIAGVLETGHDYLVYVSEILSNVEGEIQNRRSEEMFAVDMD